MKSPGRSRTGRRLSARSVVRTTARTLALLAGGVTVEVDAVGWLASGIIYADAFVNQTDRVNMHGSGPERPDRRALIAGVAFALAGSLPIVRALARDGATEAIRSLLPDLAIARELGERYLANEPAERAAGELLRSVFGELRPAVMDSRALERLKGRIRVRRARDFARGDLVLLDGWFLARTEARLLALVAMLAAP